ncbi:MAG TPA: tetratricopeptide repeat protein [Candidatus Angelobacter sp.]
MKTIQRKIMLFPLLLAALLAGAVLSLAEDNEFDRLVRNGIEESQHNNYSTALADLRAALKLNPNDANAWYQLGLVFGQMSDSGSAALAFQKAIGLKSDFAQAHFSLGLTLIANPQVQLDWPGAIREFREALGYQQDYPEALNLLGLGLMKTGDVEAAIPELRHAIRLKPDLSSAHFNLGIALEEREDFDGAAAQYREAIATKGRYPEATTALAKLLLQMGKIEEAKEELQEALRANPDLEDAHYVLARVFQKSGQRQDAAAEFDQAEDLRGRLSRATESSRLSNSGLELASKGDFSSAEASLKQAISLKPDYGLPHYNLGLILADQKGFAGAAQELIKAISLLPGRAKPWFELGRVWRLQGKINAARAAINWASCLAPEDVTIQSTLQSIEESLDPPVSGKEGRGCTRPPDLEVSSDTAEEHIAFARRLSLKRDFLGSQGELLHALAEKPSAIEARLLLANNYGTLGDTKHEELEYRKLLLQRPMDASLHMKLGNLLLLQGNAEDAVSELGIAVKEQPSSASAKTALARALKTLNSRRPAP